MFNDKVIEKSCTGERKEKPDKTGKCRCLTPVMNCQYLSNDITRLENSGVPSEKRYCEHPQKQKEQCYTGSRRTMDKRLVEFVCGSEATKCDYRGKSHERSFNGGSSILYHPCHYPK